MATDDEAAAAHARFIEAERAAKAAAAEAEDARLDGIEDEAVHYVTARMKGHATPAAALWAALGNTLDRPARNGEFDGVAEGDRLFTVSIPLKPREADFLRAIGATPIDQHMITIFRRFIAKLREENIDALNPDRTPGVYREGTELEGWQGR